MLNNRDSLRKLAESICAMVATAKASKTIEPDEDLFWKTEVEQFEYTDAGITKANTNGTYVTETSWFRAQLAIAEGISKTAEFTSTLSTLEREFPATSPMRQYLERFAGSILRICLENEQTKGVCMEFGSTIDRFIGELSGQPVTYNAKVELIGLSLRSARIQLDGDLAIRQPAKEDLEKIIRAGIHQYRSIMHPRPSAILEVSIRAGRGQNALLQARIEHCVAMLRLFGVGSVNWTSYDMSSDSLLDAFGTATMGSGGGMSPLETYVIKVDEESAVRNFWQRLSPLLPKDIYDFQKQVSHTTLAYDRYSDAVLNNGMYERRVANAVMGLEALFLEETQELSYRLGLRISKALSFLGKNPLTVRDHIKEAYAIRSTFAHGGHLDYKAKKRLERKYDDPKKLLLSVMDYLRLSILVLVVSRSSKEELVDLLDDALLDADKHQELQARVSGVKAVLEV